MVFLVSSFFLRCWRSGKFKNIAPLGFRSATTTRLLILNKTPVRYDVVMRTFSWVPGESGLEDVSTCSSDAGNVLIRSTTTVLSKPSHPDQSKPSHPDQSKPSPSDQSKPRPPDRVHPGTREPGQRPQTSNKDKLKPGTSRSMVDHLVQTNQSPILVDQSRALKEKSPLLVDQSPVLTDQSPVPTDQSPVVLFSGQEVLTANHPFQGLQHRYLLHPLALYSLNHPALYLLYHLVLLSRS